MSAEERIKESLLKLLSHKSLGKISVTEIAKDANVSRVTFYKIFTDKQEVLDKILEEYTAEFNNICNNNLSILYKIDFSDLDSFLADLTPHIFNLISFLYQKKEMIHMLMNSSDVNILKVTYNIFLPHFRTWLPQKFHLNYEPETLDQYCDFLTRGGALLIGNWFRSNFKQSPKKITDILLNMVGPNLYALYHRENH